MKLPKLCFGSKDEETVREVDINTGVANPVHATNFTRTTKYSLLTFLPKALFEQYRRVANVYFTIVAVLSLTPFSPVRPWTTWTPLIIVLGVSMLKEALEDSKRYNADRQVNNCSVEVLNLESRHFERRAWKSIVPGDVVKVDKDEYFPADLLFLSASSEEGTCYVETMNLDGETNLKIKKAPDETLTLTSNSVVDFKATIQCEPPNARLYQFTGNMLMEGASNTKLPLSPHSILLRGCSLRNTGHVIGAVIYAGHETKVFQNSRDPPSKRSVIERKVDNIIYFMFALNFSFCLSGCIAFTIWLQGNFNHHWYLYPEDEGTEYQTGKPGVVAICNFITGFILYGYLIPISLYVSIEMVKITQSMVFISKDRDMYHAETDTPALARTSNLNEDLGMVKTVLSDKTGTLTQNRMDFFKCSIAGVAYGQGFTEIEKSNAERQGRPLPTHDKSGVADAYKERFFNFYDPELMDDAWFQRPDATTIGMFFRLLAVCHTVIPDGPPDESTIKYEAESPDEAALVVAAKVMGFFCFKRTNRTVVVRERTPTGTKEKEYEVLNILEFNSTRKRMSVIVRDDEGKLLLFCKGADTVIFERLDPRHPDNVTFKGPTSEQMDVFGSSGLRTLCLSYTQLDPDEYAQWQGRWHEAKTCLEGRDEKLQELMEEVEKDLCLLGCTAIEDKLQEGVPRCIKMLADAGIRLWVLTGDKVETAINIGYACSLITEDMCQVSISAYFKEVIELEDAGSHREAAKLGSQRVEQQLDEMAKSIARADGSYDFALVIDGKALTYALGERLASKFLAVGVCCKSVLCCRVSPLQKAQITRLVKVKGGNVTLAIGDGANDVGMIQEAHIGVGISGQEGMQAVMASDFAIAQFRFLTPLLLVHGRLSYKRICRMVMFFFYKNLLFGVTLFAYNGFTTFSGQYIYNDVYMTLYNVIFTSVTPVVVGIFDRDLDRDVSLSCPQLYQQGQRNSYFNFWAVVGWLSSALYQCAFIFSLVMVACRPTEVDTEDGQPATMYYSGITMYSVIIVTVHLQISSVEEQWMWPHYVSIVGSQVIWWIFLVVFNFLPLSISADLYHLFIGMVAPNPRYWLLVLLLPIGAVLPDFCFRSMRRWISPSEHQIIAESHRMQIDTDPVDPAHQAARGGVGGTSAGVAVAAVSPQADVKLEGGTEGHHTPGLSRNSGFVPPYDPKSRFYSFIHATRADERNGSRQPDSLARGDVVQNAVLAQLDNDLASQPLHPSTAAFYHLPPHSSGPSGSSLTQPMDAAAAATAATAANTAAAAAAAAAAATLPIAHGVRIYNNPLHEASASNSEDINYHNPLHGNDEDDDDSGGKNGGSRDGVSVFIDDGPDLGVDNDGGNVFKEEGDDFLRLDLSGSDEDGFDNPLHNGRV